MKYLFALFFCFAHLASAQLVTTPAPATFQPETLAYKASILAAGSDISDSQLALTDALVLKLKNLPAGDFYATCREIYPMVGRDLTARLIKLKYDTTTSAGYARNICTFTTKSPANNDTVTIGGQVYTFKTSLTGAANEVLISSSSDTVNSIVNAVAAINGSAGAGTTYGTGTVANASVTAVYSFNPNPGYYEIDVKAITAGTTGASVTVSKSSSVAYWANGSTTLFFGVNGPSLQVISVNASYPVSGFGSSDERPLDPGAANNYRLFVTTNYDPVANSTGINQGNISFGVALPARNFSGTTVFGNGDTGTGYPGSGVTPTFISTQYFGTANKSYQGLVNEPGLFVANQSASITSAYTNGVSIYRGAGSFAQTAFGSSMFSFYRQTNTAGPYGLTSGTMAVGFGFVAAGASDVLLQQASEVIRDYLVTLGRLPNYSRFALAIGDSVTQGTGANNDSAIFIRALANALGLPLVGAGNPGENFLNGSAPNARILTLSNLTTGFPSHIFLGPSVNDIRTDGASALQAANPTTLANYGTAVASFVSTYAVATSPALGKKNPELILLTTPFWQRYDASNTTHTGGGSAYSSTGQAFVNARTEQYANQIASAAFSTSATTLNGIVRFADMSHIAEDVPTNYSRGDTYFTQGSPFSNDGLHPNDAGHIEMGRQAVRGIRGVLYRKPLVTFPSAGVIAAGSSAIGQVTSFTGGNPTSANNTWAIAGSAGTGALTNNIVMLGARPGNIVTVSGPQSPVTSLSSITSDGNATNDTFTKTAHGLRNGWIVTQSGFSGDTNANGIWIVTNVTANTYQLTDFAGAAMRGSASSGSGGALTTGVPTGTLFTGTVYENDIATVTATNPTAGSITVPPSYLGISVQTQ